MCIHLYSCCCEVCKWLAHESKGPPAAIAVADLLDMCVPCICCALVCASVPLLPSNLCSHLMIREFWACE